MREWADKWMSLVELETDGAMSLAIVATRAGVLFRVETHHKGERKDLAYDEMVMWPESAWDGLCEAKIKKAIEHVRRELKWLDAAPACNR